MKNLLVLLAVVMLAVPAMAVSISATADGTDVTISYALGQDEVGLRGVALTVTLTGGTLQSVEDIVALNTEFNAYIDYYVTNGVGTSLPGEDAHPLCDPDAAGVATLPASVFGICMGYLDEDGNETLGQPAPGNDTDLITFTVTCDEGAEMVGVAVALDDLRGGVVGDGLVEVVVPAEDLEVTCGEPEPECWSYPCFAKGDTDGNGVLDITDVNALIAAWGAQYDPCVDFDKNGVVGIDDVNVIINNWGTTLDCQ